MMLLLFLAILCVSFGTSLNGSSPSSSSSSYFKYNSTYCAMYTKKCQIELNLPQIGNESLEIPHKKSKFYEFLSLEQFENSNQTFIHIRPLLVGVDSIELIDDSHRIIVTSPNRFIDKIFQGYIIVIQLTVSTIMGILLDFNILINIVRKPFPVLIGFLAQYLCMPLLAFCIIKVSSQTPIDALALFIYSTCPGGSASNNWSILLNGDIDLSAMLTFVSTMASFFCMPLWLFTLGGTFTTAANIQIPYTRLIMNLCTTIGPCLSGLVLSRFIPKLRPFFIRIVKPFVIFTLLSFLALTMYARFYVFYLINWKQWLVAPLIPWLGFVVGGVVAKLARLPLTQIITIGIETGIQNVGIAFLIVMYNFPSPESDYAILPLISVSALTGIPLWFTLLYSSIRDRIKRPTKEEKEIHLKQQGEKLLNTQEQSQQNV